MGLRKWSFSRPRRLVTTETRVLELFEVLRRADPRHGEPALKCAQRLTVVAEELVEQAPPRRVGQGFEHGVHSSDDTSPFGYMSRTEVRCLRISAASAPESPTR